MSRPVVLALPLVAVVSSLVIGRVWNRRDKGGVTLPAADASPPEGDPLST